MLRSWAGLLLKPHNVLLVAINSILIYHILGKYFPSQPVFKDDRDFGSTENSAETCPLNKPRPTESVKMEYRDYTIDELRKFDGVQNKNILVAIDMRVFDVTKARKLYGPGTQSHLDYVSCVFVGGSYEAFAGRDASRSLAMGKVYKYPKSVIQDYDHLTDLSPRERDILNDWVEHYDKRYEIVGTLLPFHLENQESDLESDQPRGGGFLPED